VIARFSHHLVLQLSAHCHNCDQSQNRINADGHADLIQDARVDLMVAGIHGALAGWSIDCSPAVARIRQGRLPVIEADDTHVSRRLAEHASARATS
jgi:hypothetical protein